jgi:hypothetical protein
MQSPPSCPSPRHCRATLGAGSRPMMPNARAYNPDPMYIAKKIKMRKMRIATRPHKWEGQHNGVGGDTYLQWCQVCIPYQNTVQVRRRAPPNPRWSISSRPIHIAPRRQQDHDGPHHFVSPRIQKRTKHPGSGGVTRVGNKTHWNDG